MSNSVEQSLKNEIARREQELARLREALRVLGGTVVIGKLRKTKTKSGAGRGPKGPKSDEQKAKISQALKKAWARRKKAAAQQ
ncbi:MAG TPA: hypothetical protein PLQ67_06975 [Burkholderiaceae bacterium]|nr:hypothetical protein [Burkholderiaceae bacterium]